MNVKSISNIQKLITFGITISMMMTLVFVSKSSHFTLNPTLFSFGITFDFIISIPLIYYLLIRNTSIDKRSIIAILIIGLFVSTYIIPIENQALLLNFKKWILPIIEIGVFSYLFVKVRKAIINLRESKNVSLDFYSTLKTVAVEILPKRIAEIFITEIAVFYYGFFNWTSKQYTKYEFTYHIKTGNVSLLYALIGIVLIETTALHFLILKYSYSIAWLLSGLSFYTAIQIFGFARAIPKRPIILFEKSVFLPYGIFSETEINFNEIVEIKAIKNLDFADKSIIQLSILKQFESPNILIYLKNKNILNKLYGFKKRYQKIAFFVDEPQRFIMNINEFIHKS